jgi:pyridoxal phosphate enzyme (YggS family)
LAAPPRPAAAAAHRRRPARPQVLARVEAAAARVSRPRPRLVAVSKTKPAATVAEAYAAGQRDFGENYVQELLDKAPALPADVRWHFIGHLQSNKARVLVEGVPGLAMVETVDSEKLASRLNAAAAGAGRPPLAVLVQVNTSGEASKHGVAPADAPALAAHVAARCTHLRLAGLMTIGQPDYTSRPENFECLAACRRAVAAATGFPEAELELSMGMSGDFEAAIVMGATNVRVGSTIFGARLNPPPE